jgi:hypothetical protein
MEPSAIHMQNLFAIQVRKKDTFVLLYAMEEGLFLRASLEF